MNDTQPKPCPHYPNLMTHECSKCARNERARNRARDARNEAAPLTLTAAQARSLVALLGAWRPGIDRAGAVTIYAHPVGTITVDFDGMPARDAWA